MSNNNDIPAQTSPTTATVDLETPIERGSGKAVTQITLRKPVAGELRGLAMTDLMQMEYGALSTVLPRIADPVLTASEIAALDPADLIQMATEIVGFLLPKGAKQGG